jgi:hypothetical protein
MPCPKGQGVDAEKKPHGKADEISFTCLLARAGAFGPALGTAKPATGSRMMLTYLSGFCRA